MNPLIVDDHTTHHVLGVHVQIARCSHERVVECSPGAFEPVLSHKIHKSQVEVGEVHAQSHPCLVEAAANQEEEQGKDFGYCSRYGNHAIVAEMGIGWMTNN